MSADWIKVEVTLPDKPEVVQMAEILSLDQDTIAGKLLRFWIWVNQNAADGNALSVTKKFVDRLCARDGFADALEIVKWASFQNGVLAVPNFDRHNGKSAKKRALGVYRSRAHRENGDAPVTPPSRAERHGSVTRDRDRGITTSVARERARASNKDTNHDDKKGATPDDTTPAGEIVAAFNELCPELKPVTMRSPKRMEAIGNFWGYVGRNMENVRAVFQRVALSDVLCGRSKPKHAGHEPYRTFFDKVIQPDLVARIIEGQFDNKR